MFTLAEGARLLALRALDMRDIMRLLMPRHCRYVLMPAVTYYAAVFGMLITCHYIYAIITPLLMLFMPPFRA